MLSTALPYVLKISTLLHRRRTLFSLGTPFELDGCGFLLLAAPVLELAAMSHLPPMLLRFRLTSEGKQILELGVISGRLDVGLLLPSSLHRDLS